LIALEYAIEAGSDLDGVIVSAPALAQPNVARWVPPLLRALAKVAPTLAVNPKMDLGAFTRDRDEVAKLEADPLRYPKVTSRLAGEFEAAVARVQANAHRLEVPVLIVVGQADAVTPPNGSKTFFGNVSIDDKTLKAYEGGFHQPILDTNRDESLSDIRTWIHAHSYS
jgi:alpha-beta hydrolase superfamily lysophospholipase